MRMFAPPPKLTISEWSDRERRLSPEASAEPGRWDTTRTEYLRGIMDAMSDPAIWKVVVIKGAQVGWTECLNNLVGYHIDRDPAPILVLQPTIEVGEAWSKDRLAPMLRDTPVLIGKVAEPKSRDSNNTIRQKVFPGGRLTIVGANAPAGLAARPIRIVLADEVDRYNASAGGAEKGEGDPLALAAKRQITFWNRKTLLGSTPKNKGTSIVEREWLASDQRRYFVPCPECAHKQTIRWAQVRWDKDENGKHLPETAHYVCEHCGAIWSDLDRWDATKHGEWRKQRANVQGVAGFHISGLMSPWLTLETIVCEFLAAKDDPDLLKVWVNTVLGETWEEAAEKIEDLNLLARVENYSPLTLPDRVRLLTAGVDVHQDRLEAQITAWAAGEESWVVAHEVIFGDPAQDYVWQMLDRVLLTRCSTEGGRELRIRTTCVDTGGHHGNEVLQYCRTRRRRGVYPIKGAAGPRPVWPRRASRTKTNDFIFLIGVDTAKDTLYGRLRIKEPGPGYIHFPVGQGVDDRYFEQLKSEQVVTRKKEGRPYRVWVLPSGKRNEALDCAVMSLAARLSIPVRLDALPDMPPPELPPPTDSVEASERSPQPQPMAAAPFGSSGVAHSMIRPGGWLGNRGGGWMSRGR